MNNQVIEVLAQFILGAQNEKNDSITEGNVTVRGCRYLLGQIIREIVLPDDHYYFSEKAIDKWRNITSEKWMGKGYQQKVCCDRAGKSGNPDDYTVLLFKGNAKSYESKKVLTQGESIIYRSVFHDEHMITVSDIINKLLNLNPLTEEGIQQIIKDNLYLCRMLKEENVKIPSGEIKTRGGKTVD